MRAQTLWREVWEQVSPKAGPKAVLRLLGLAQVVQVQSQTNVDQPQIHGHIDHTEPKHLLHCNAQLESQKRSCTEDKGSQST